MANTENNKTKVNRRSPLEGSQAKPTTLADTTKIDIDIDKALIDDILIAGEHSQLDSSALERFTTMSNVREQKYQTIDTMMKDSTVSSIVRTYTEDACEMADSGHIVWCESNDPNISKFVNYLLNVMNVDKNSFGWVYSLITNGDLYLKMFRESDYEDDIFQQDNIKNMYSARNVLNEEYLKENKLEENVYLNIRSTSDHYSYHLEAIPNPGTMYELTKYGRTYGYIETPDADTTTDFTDIVSGSNMGDNSIIYNYHLKSNDVIVHQADDYVHACLEDGIPRYPEKVKLFNTEEDLKAGTNAHTYSVRSGKSMLYDSYKIWREKSLLEASVLLSRVTRSSLIRKIGVEVPDTSKEKTKSILRNVKSLFEQQTALKTDGSMSEYTNPGAIVNNVIYATHEGKGAITVEAIGEDPNIKDLADLDNWTNKYYASYGIPKQYFGYTDDAAGFNGGSSLSIISSIYAKAVKRIQNAYIQCLTDAINLILLDRGYKSYLNNFVLKMKAPLTQEEKDYREDLSNRISAISNMLSLFGDIEDKPRKLTILKELVITLNYGDELVHQIQLEIDDAIIAKEKAAKEAEEQAALEAAQNGGEETGGEALGGDEDLGSTEDAGTPATEDIDQQIDAGLPAAESFTPEAGTEILHEDITELTEDEELPSPEELNADIDFTENS